MGAIATIILVVVLLVFALMQSKKQKAVANTKLPALAPLLQGEVREEKVTGTHAGLPARGWIFSRRTGNDHHDYYWATQVQIGLPEAWELVYSGKGLMGLGKKEVFIRTKDEALRARLEAAGLVQYMSQIPQVLEGRSDLSLGHGWLSFNVRINDGGAVPTPEAFQWSLQVLDGIITIIRQAAA